MGTQVFVGNTGKKPRGESLKPNLRNLALPAALDMEKAV